MKRISFDQLAGKTIKNAEIILMNDGRQESDLLEFTFSDGSSFVLNITPAQPRLEYATAENEQDDLHPGAPIEREKS